MRALSVFVSVSLCLLGAGIGVAQEGHPLKGSWLGAWESNSVHGDDIVVILDWNGERISGIINPGTDNIEIDRATLDPENWSVHIEADAETEDGRSVRYVIDGTIQDLELPNRYIVGSWSSERGSGDFEMRRQ